MSETQASYFIVDRLALIVLPATPKRVKTKAKKKQPRKNVPILKNFLDLPLDIIYETFAYLEPPDLLVLARLSKDFRSLFMSRSSLTIWRRVLNDVLNLPPCPQDLSEPQYASLMFDKFCMACGSTRGSIGVDFKTRLRFCATCNKLNIVRGYSSRTECDVALTRKAVTIIPFFSQEYWPYGGTPADYSSADNKLGLYYFKPELELALSALSTHTNDTEEFLAEQQAIATRMIKEGIAMQAYHDEVLYEREMIADMMTTKRYKRIEEEMQALGWQTDLYCPAPGDDDFEKWEEYLFQPKEFTTRGWNSIRPKLEAIYSRCRQAQLIDDLMHRIAESYLSYRERQQDEVRRTIPPWCDVCDFEVVGDFCSEHYEDCSEEQVDELIPLVIAEAADFPALVEHQLAHVIVKADRTQKFVCQDSGKIHFATSSVSTSAPATEPVANKSSKAKGKAKAQADLGKSATEILGQAANLFMCHCYSCSERQSGVVRMFAYPEIVNHVIKDRELSRRWIQLIPPSHWEVIQAARDILTALDLPDDCPHADVRAVGKLVCGCGHYRFEGPLTFEQLVGHVYEQQTWNTAIIPNVDSASEHLIDKLVVNGHSRERLKELVRRATEEELAAASERDAQNKDCEGSQDSVETVEVSSDVIPGLYCRYCYQLELEGNLVRNEMMAYHVKYRHGKESADTDFEELGILADEYGERDDSSFFFPGFFLPDFFHWP